MSSNNYDGATPLPFQWWMANIGSWPNCSFCHQSAGAHHADHGACPDPNFGGYYAKSYYCNPQQQVAVAPKFVKCLDNKDMGISYLVIGNIYEVLFTNKFGEYALLDVPGYWNKHRFAEHNLSVPLPTHSTGIPANFKKAYDPNEECPCGLIASQCDYHRP
jgi:hypothetical protein